MNGEGAHPTLFVNCMRSRSTVLKYGNGFKFNCNCERLKSLFHHVKQ